MEKVNMINSKYLQMCCVYYGEIAGSLSDADRASLSRMMSQREIEEKLTFYKISDKEILSFLKLTPDARKKRKIQPREKYLLFCITSLVYLKSARNLMKEVDKLPFDGPYRTVIAEWGFRALEVSGTLSACAVDPYDLYLT
jgi:hypothetical protein